MNGVALEARNISKDYGGVHALRCAHLVLKAGEIHGLIGANGAGKSTLCKIIAGAETTSSGELIVGGKSVVFQSVRDAAAHGVDMVHQELSLFPNLSVADNIFMGRELRTRAGLVDQNAQKRAAAAALARLGHPLDPTTPVGVLPIGLQQIVEIARALAHEANILLLDEPTSALSASETPRLFEIVRTLAAQGVAVVYISHRLDELLAISSCVTVLRDGEVVAAAEPSDRLSPAWLVEKMTGQVASVSFASAAINQPKPLLVVRGLTLPPRHGRVALEQIDLDVGAGEVVGVFGLLGSGRTELLEALMGLHADASGQQDLAGRDLAALDTVERVASGLALAPEDRQRDGLFANLSVLRNMSLSALPQFSRWLGFDDKAERGAANACGADLRLKAPSLDAAVGALSGGNQQKVVLARCLMSRPKMLLLDEPARGVDVAAKADIVQALHQLASTGLGVMFTSSEAADVMAGSTRVIVLSRGRVALSARPQDVSEAILAEAAAVNAQRDEIAA